MKTTIDTSGAREEFRKAQELFRKEVLRRFQYAGMEAVKIARTTHGYMDQTGNLTSSMGALVAEDGKVIWSTGFDAISGSASEGPGAGQELAQKIVSENNVGFLLVVVAGMHYASYVERGHTMKNGRFVRGRPVLSGASSQLPTILNTLLSQLSLTGNV